MPDKHKPGYRKPRTGEKRRTRQPFKLDRLPQETRDRILKARNKEGKTWAEVAELASKLAGQPVSDEACRRWYDVRVEQEYAEVFRQAAAAREIAAKFAELGFAKLPEATMNALSAEVFSIGNAKNTAERQAALGNLAFLLSKTIDAQSKQKRAEIEERRQNLAEKKFEDVKAKADKATNEAAEKLGKGKELTVADINSIRRKVFGLGPAPGTAG